MTYIERHNVSPKMKNFQLELGGSIYSFTREKEGAPLIARVSIPEHIVFFRNNPQDYREVVQEAMTISVDDARAMVEQIDRLERRVFYLQQEVEKGQKALQRIPELENQVDVATAERNSLVEQLDQERTKVADLTEQLSIATAAAEKSAEVLSGGEVILPDSEEAPGVVADPVKEQE